METSMAQQVTATRPTIEEVVARAEELVPRLRERAARAEEQRRVPEETIEDFRRAGLFRVFQPARYGGYELDYGTTQLDLAGILGRGCASSAWVQSVVACHAWILGMYPEAAQDAVWRSDPDTLVATAFATTTGIGRPVDGGYLVQGQWQFSSGVDACDWAILSMPLEGVRSRYGRFALLPRSEWEIVDTWFPSGLRGTGSKDILVKEAFVPHERTIDPLNPYADRSPASSGNSCYIYHLPILSIFPYNVATPALGAARGALEAFIQQTASRPDRANEAAKQLRVAESAAEIDAGEALLRADAAEIARLGRVDGPIPPDRQLKWKRNLAYAGVLWTRAVDRLETAVGAHGILESNPIHLAARDIHAIANHVGLSWDLAAIPYGKAALGLDP